MALNPCVQQILCGLGNAVLSALKGIITAQKAVVTAAIVQAEAQLAIVRITTAPISAAAQVAQQVVDGAHAAANLVPLAILSNCADLGELNISINTSIDSALREVNTILADANRLLSFADELDALVVELNATIAQFDAILDVIALCAAGG